MQRDGADPDFLGRLGLAENGAWALLPKCEAPEKPVEDPIYPGPLLADLAVRHGYSRARSTAAAPVRATRTGRYCASAALGVPGQEATVVVVHRVEKPNLDDGRRRRTGWP